MLRNGVDCSQISPHATYIFKASTMLHFTTLIVVIILFIGCDSDRNQKSEERNNTSIKTTDLVDKGEDLKNKLFHQDLNKSYDQLAGRPWVLAKPKGPFVDSNSTVLE